ncbi:MAG TPA: phage virion morphogenesis protein [Thermoanaerobaculia bacterium]|jgi:hypothetical protein|nr:phage virion morphogenesis protein [Thermoanaerobaculia bacterium]
MAMGLDVTGLDVMQKALELAVARSQDMAQVWNDFGEEAILQTHLRAAGGIAPDGSAWPVSARAAGVSGQTLDRTGRLLASASYEWNGREFTLFSDDIRAAVHQEGKTIRPTAGKKALAIPMSEEVASQYKAGVSIREQWPDSFLLVSEAGNAFIVQRRGQRIAHTSSQLGAIEFLFMLVPSVTEPERRWLGFSETDILGFEGIVIRHYGLFGQGGDA